MNDLEPGDIKRLSEEAERQKRECLAEWCLFLLLPTGLGSLGSTEGGIFEWSVGPSPRDPLVIP